MDDRKSAHPSLFVDIDIGFEEFIDHFTMAVSGRYVQTTSTILKQQ